MYPDRLYADTGGLLEHSEMLRGERNIASQICDLIRRAQCYGSPDLIPLYRRAFSSAEALTAYFTVMSDAMIQCSEILESASQKKKEVLEDTDARIRSLLEN